MLAYFSRRKLFHAFPFYNNVSHYLIVASRDRALSLLTNFLSHDLFVGESRPSFAYPSGVSNAWGPASATHTRCSLSSLTHPEYNVMNTLCLTPSMNTALSPSMRISTDLSPLSIWTTIRAECVVRTGSDRVDLPLRDKVQLVQKQYASELGCPLRSVSHFGERGVQPET